MFTGIITDIGKIVEISDSTVWIETKHPPKEINVGSSVSCSGICLTVISVRESNQGSIFGVNISKETKSKTNSGSWQVGTLINIEPSMRMGGEIGGHLVTGHIDDLSEVTNIEEVGNSFIVSIKTTPHIARFVAQKGSIVLDGVSLTVNEVDGQEFNVCIIPHTWQETTLGLAETGTLLNTEIDLIARYVEKLIVK